MGEESSELVFVWIGVVTVTLVSFWAQAIITEERFVPWLNVIANHWNIQDDVAGATIMAAGASAPELLASFVSIFVTHSSLGLGTIIGSEIFNQLCCTAGAILAAKDQKLELNPIVVAREVLFYGLSLVLLLVAISDRRPTDDDIENEDHLYVSIKDCGILLSGYLLYVVVCAFSDKITSCLEGQEEEAIRSEHSFYYEYFPDRDVMFDVLPNVFMFHGHEIIESAGDKPIMPTEESDSKHKSIIAYPEDARFVCVALHYTLYPFKAMIHYTIPDVQNTPTTVRYMILSTTSCLIWLIILSYAMVFCLERMGFLMNVPDSIIGITISAAGTSLPVYVASQVAAREGYGNMAVANVFGANTFNILIGLGLPWMIYTLTEGDGVYHELRDDEITESVMILSGVLLIFILLTVQSKFVLHRWHAMCFFGMYVLYLAYAISMVYVEDLDNMEYDEQQEKNER